MWDVWLQRHTRCDPLYHCRCRTSSQTSPSVGLWSQARLRWSHTHTPGMKTRIHDSNVNHLFKADLSVNFFLISCSKTGPINYLTLKQLYNCGIYQFLQRTKFECKIDYWCFMLLQICCVVLIHTYHITNRLCKHIYAAQSSLLHWPVTYQMS